MDVYEVRDENGELMGEFRTAEPANARKLKWRLEDRRWSLTDVTGTSRG